MSTLNDPISELFRQVVEEYGGRVILAPTISHDEYGWSICDAHVEGVSIPVHFLGNIFSAKADLLVWDAWKGL